MNSRQNGRREPYFGSVRFFKHLILATLALLIIIPTCLAVSFKIQNDKLIKERDGLYSQSQVDAAVAAAVAESLALAEEAKPVSISSDQYGEILVDAESWEMMLVNDSHPISSKFKVKLEEIQPGQCVDERIVADLKRMISAAVDEGYQLHIYSSFRDMKKQQSLFNDCLVRLQEVGMDYWQAFYESKARIALPGTSEHQTGLAVDIAAKDYFYLDEKRGDQAEAVWLAKNSYLYGFILRYPENKEEITGIRYEPEHFRYVGKPAAKFLMENDLALEEFHDILLEKGRAETSQ